MSEAYSRRHSLEEGRSQNGLDLSRYSLEVSTNFDFMSDEYRSLYSRSNATAFQHPIWLAHIRSHLLSKASTSVITVRTADGSLCFMHPLVRNKLGPFSYLDTMDGSVCDYNALVFDPSEMSADVAWRLLRREVGHRLCRVRRLRHEDTITPELGRKTFMGYYAHEVPLKHPYENLKVNKLDQKHRRLSRKGTIEFRVETEDAAILETLASIRKFRTSRFENDPLHSETVFEFYRAIAVAGHREGFARTYGCYLDGQLIAGIFGLSHKGRFLFLLLGFEQSDRLKNLSIGCLMVEDVIRHCTERGDLVFDFTIGDEPYKDLFSPKRTAMLTGWIGNPLSCWAADRVFSAVVARRLKEQEKARA